MGLDITAYRGLTAAPDLKFDADGVPDGGYGTHMNVRANGDFPGREAPLAEGWYAFAEEIGFRAGSYSGYNAWREKLAKLAGYPAVRHDPGYRAAEDSHAAGAWERTEGPFWELIHFTDCDGVIGPAAAAKLAGDFAKFDDLAKQLPADLDDGWFYDRYKLWRAAFEMAAAGCAVVFH